MAVRVGTCAWADHEHFYPRGVGPGERLSFYARFFSLVEVDSTYYRIPSPAVVERWTESTPDDFVFDVKVHRTLTYHDRQSVSADERERDHRLFQAALAPLTASGKLGSLLFQFPPWFVASEANRQAVEATVARYQDAVVAVEFRHRSWWQSQRAEETRAWLTAMQAVNVVCDEPQTGMGTVPFVPDVTNSAVVVFRLHGRNAETWYQKGLTSSQQRFDYLYTPDELSDFLPAVRMWTETASDVHILMNNNQGDYAVRNALDWMNLLSIPVQGDLSELPGRQSLLF